MKQIIMVAALVVGVMTTSHTTIGAGTSEAFTIGYLHKSCKFVVEKNFSDSTRNRAYSLGHCLGSISGFLNGYDVALVADAFRKYGKKAFDQRGKFKTGLELWCLPDGVRTDQASAVFVRWADNNPSRWHEHFRDGLTAAFTEAWPCKK